MSTDQNPLAPFDAAFEQRTREEAEAREKEEASHAEHMEKLRAIASMARGSGWKVFQEWVAQQANEVMTAMMGENNPTALAKLTGRLHVFMTMRTWAEANLREYKVEE